MPQCDATTTAGKPCRALAKQGESKCSAHLGTAHRPTKLDEHMEERILTAIRAGNYPTTAARMAGIHATTLASWRERGELGQEPFCSFLERMEKARAEGEVSLVARIAQAGRETWQANAWLLERQYPDRWGRRERHEHTGRDGGPIEVADGIRDPAVREAGRRLVRAVEAARSGEPGGSGSGD